MGEKEAPKQIPEHKVGGSFQPFKELSTFPQLTIDHDDYSQRLFVYEFIFKGVNCAISINAFYPDNLSRKETPLGRIRIVRTGEGGEERLEELPIAFYLTSKVSSFEKLEEFGQYSLEFTLGERNYYLSFAGQDKNITREDLEVGDGVLDSSMKNANGEDNYVALPFNAELIRDLNVGIIQKDMSPKKSK